jgi:small subunit ribosomal protein S19e
VNYTRNQKRHGATANLPTPHNIPAPIYIQQLAKYIKDNIDQVQPPPWANIAKTSSHAQRQPDDPDWWFTRAASILRKIYIHGPIGTQHLRADYGGRKGTHAIREHARKGGGSNIRKIMQQLESAGLIETDKNRGRTISREGRRALDKLAGDIQEQLAKKQPELSKYP